MNRLTLILFFVILMGAIVVSAYALPWESRVQQQAVAAPLPPGGHVPEITDISGGSNREPRGEDVGLSAYLDIPEHLPVIAKINLKITLENASGIPLFFLTWHTLGISPEIIG